MRKLTLEQIETVILDFWQGSPLNSLHMQGGEKAWKQPHIAVAAASDPLFVEIKKMIGPFYWTPEEAFALGRPGLQASAEELSVISYVLPQTEATRSDQRAMNELPAERWARSRYHGEEFNCGLRSHLAGRLSAAGYPAVAPERLLDFDYRTSEKFGIASNWSERHVAFVAGHGTFGLSDGLITRFGKAVRFGSVVVKADLPVTSRMYGEDHQAWCLWYAKGKCGACVHRCPIDAIAKDVGHDKPACFKYIRGVTAPYVAKNFGLGDTPCGLCQVKIPCEAQIPSALQANG
ncbi:4Fe-4S ferredoxin [Malonomonas rubra]|nr:4Fe-4S ferredoxin [Malonomonas rubra]